MRLTEKKLVKKFAFYGFFKNLRFFEPFLYLFFLRIGLSYLQIGSLISIREIVRNIFEVPSGVFADSYGRKRTLQLCFILYIFSFVIFFFSQGYFNVVLAMVLFGMGEAFRSGTHKAVIFAYLDHHQQAHRKVEVYGFTKSYSLIGSSLSAVIGAVIVFVESNYRLIFVLSVIPYMIDFLLISSYPDYVDGGSGEGLAFNSLINGAKRSFASLTEIVNLRRGLVNSAVFDGYFKALKDYLQPVLQSQVLVVPVLIMFKNQDRRLSVLLGLSYFMIYIISSYTTRNAYRLKRFNRNSSDILNLSYILAIPGIGLIGISHYFQLSWLVIISYLIYYVFRNMRRPFMLDYLADLMHEEDRATLLSLESQFTTITVIVVSPLLGVVADYWGLALMFAVAALSMLILYSMTALRSLTCF